MKLGVPTDSSMFLDDDDEPSGRPREKAGVIKINKEAVQHMKSQKKRSARDVPDHLQAKGRRGIKRRYASMCRSHYLYTRSRWPLYWSLLTLLRTAGGWIRRAISTAFLRMHGRPCGRMKSLSPSAPQWTHAQAQKPFFCYFVFRFFFRVCLPFRSAVDSALRHAQEEFVFQYFFSKSFPVCCAIDSRTGTDSQKYSV